MPPKSINKGRKRSGRKLRRRSGVGKKLVKSRAGNRRVKHDERRSVSACIDRGSIPVTPQMIRWAVRELHGKRVFVRSALIAKHLQRCYPIESDPAMLKQELEDKLKVAVCVGLIARCGTDAYCLPTLRQEANTRKTDFSAFWETYNKRGSRHRRNTLENTRKKTRKPSHGGLSDYSGDDDEESDIP